jgi:hypothetical protein
MKQLSIAFSLLLAASVVCAAEAKKADAQPADGPAPIVTTAPSASDSPLVAAAKKSKRGKAKAGTTVITNDTLAKSGGHLTEAAKLADLPTPAPVKPATVDPMAAEYARRAEAVKKLEAEKKAKEVAEKKKSDSDRATAATNDDTLDERFDDPAQAEHAMAEQAATDKKPPQP